jgi:hypothetical protein
MEKDCGAMSASPDVTHSVGNASAAANGASGVLADAVVVIGQVVVLGLLIIPGAAAA